MNPGTTVVRMKQTSAMRIRLIVNRCPAFGAVVARLPPSHTLHFEAYERVMEKALTLVFEDLKLTREEADEILALCDVPETVIETELRIMLTQRELRTRYEFLTGNVLHGENHSDVRAFGIYCVALVSRLYRLQEQALLEREVPRPAIAEA